MADLLTQYRTALLQQDIDCLDALLQSDPPLAQASARLQPATRSAVLDAPTFRDAIATTFRTLIITDVQLPAEAIQVAPDACCVTFLEVESVEDPRAFMQQTRLYRTTFALTQDRAGGVITFRIAAVQRDGPLIRVTTRGQVQAGALTRVEAEGSADPFALAGVEVAVPETGAVQTLRAAGNRWQGLFIAPRVPKPQPLTVRLRGTTGEELRLSHPYRVRLPGEGVAEQITGTDVTHFFAVAVEPDGTVWAGGDGGGRLYQVRPRASEATRVGQLLADPAGRVEDLVVDQLGRVHTLVFASQMAGDIVIDQDRFCQTVNVFDPAYPFRVRDLQTGGIQPSPSTRALAAGGGDIWLFGSDGGVARVADTFREGQCLASGVGVRYGPIFRREDSGLLANTVPALAVGVDGTLWFGTALGLTGFKNSQFTPVPFDPTMPLRGDAATLEAFFRAVAQAIFDSRPLTTVGVGAVSFVTAFGRPLVKEDVIFSLVVDRQNRLWVGTLGGGLRRIEAGKEILHLTRSNGLSSNLILSLATGPEDTVWAATDKGVHRLQEVNGTLTITTFTALDGLGTPVRDVIVDKQGIVWMATDGGLFRLVERGEVIQGVVRDQAGRPVAGADVIVVGTPFRAVTDAQGHFMLTGLLPGSYRLQVDGSLADGGPLAQTAVDIVVTTGTQNLDPIVLPGVGTGSHQLRVVAGDGQTGVVGTPLALPLTVAVTDAQDAPVPGIPVMFTVVEGSGLLAPSQAVTDATGQAASTLTLRTTGISHVQASAEGQVVLFTATGQEVLARARLIEVSGNRQIATPGEVLPEPLVVRLEDQLGNPVAGETLTAALVQGVGELLAGQTSSTSLVTVQTNAQGEAALRLRPGASEQDLVVEVAVPDLPEVPPVQFLAFVGFRALSAIAVETNGKLVVVDEHLAGVVRVDPSSGERTIVSNATTGSGPLFADPVTIAVEASGALVVVDFGPAAVVRVDPTSGNRTVISSATTGRGPLFADPVAIAVEASGALVVVDFGRAAMVRVDPASGDRTIVSDTTTGRGPPFSTPLALAMEADGHLVVADSVLDAVVRVDPRSGDRTIVSDTTTGQGPGFVVPTAIAVEADGHLLVVEGAGGLRAILRVEPRSGDRTILSDAVTGSGPPFADPIALAVEADGHLVVADRDLATLVRVDPRSGDRTLVLQSTLGNGPALRDPLALALEADDHPLVADTILAAVVRVDLLSGDRSIVSDAITGSGPQLQAPFGLAVEADGHMVVLDTRVVLRVDPHSGERTIVSGGSIARGGGPAFSTPSGIAVEADGHLLVLESANGLRAIMRLDPQSGDRIIVSDAMTGQGPVFVVPAVIAVEADGHLLVVDGSGGLRAIMRVDPHSGDRTIISNATTGQGPDFVVPTAIAVEADGHLVLVDAGLAALVRVDPTNGDRIIVSGGSLARGSGPPLSNPTGIAVQTDGQLLVVDKFFRWIVRIDPGNGNRTLISQ